MAPPWTPVHSLYEPDDDDYIDLATLGHIRSGHSWKLDGACVNRWDDFYPEGRSDSPITISWIANARAICDTCPVRLTCLETALRTREKHGIWGGTTGRQRGRILKAIDNPDTDTTLDDVLTSFATRDGNLYTRLKDDT